MEAEEEDEELPTEAPMALKYETPPTTGKEEHAVQSTQDVVRRFPVQLRWVTASRGLHLVQVLNCLLLELVQHWLPLLPAEGNVHGGLRLVLQRSQKRRNKNSRRKPFANGNKKPEQTGGNRSKPEETGENRFLSEKPVCKHFTVASYSGF